MCGGCSRLHCLVCFQVNPTAVRSTLTSYQYWLPACCCCPSSRCCRWSAGTLTNLPSPPLGSPSASAASAPHFQQQSYGWTWTGRGGSWPGGPWAGRCLPPSSPAGGWCTAPSRPAQSVQGFRGGRVNGQIWHAVMLVFRAVRSLLYLRSSVEVEHRQLLLGDDAPHLLPRLVLLTVLQEAADDAAARELGCLDLLGGREQRRRLRLKPRLSVCLCTF